MDKIEVREVVGCEHVEMTQNPFFSKVPNVCVRFAPVVYVVVEEGKIKIVCGECARRAIFST